MLKMTELGKKKRKLNASYDSPVAVVNDIKFPKTCRGADYDSN